MPYGETSKDPIRDSEIGTVQQPESKILVHPEYLTMKRSRKDKRRAKNRVARTSRRKNRA